MESFIEFRCDTQRKDDSLLFVFDFLYGDVRLYLSILVRKGCTINIFKK